MTTVWMIAGFTIVALAVAWLVWVRVRDSRTRVTELQNEVAELKKNLQIFNEGAVGIGRRLLEAERQLQAVATDQQQLKAQAEEASYARALELLAQGEGVDSLISQCGMARAEAELMLLVNRQLQEPGAP